MNCIPQRKHHYIKFILPLNTYAAAAFACPKSQVLKLLILKSLFLKERRPKHTLTRMAKRRKRKSHANAKSLLIVATTILLSNSALVLSLTTKCSINLYGSSYSLVSSWHQSSTISKMVQDINSLLKLFKATKCAHQVTLDTQAFNVRVCLWLQRNSAFPVLMARLDKSSTTE